MRTLFRRHRMLTLIGGAAVIVVAGGLTLYFTVFSSNSPKKLALSTTANPVTITPAQLPGNWTVATGSTVGYRVREQLGALPAPDDAVGRTSSVTGSVTLAGSGGGVAANGANFKADVTSLKSDKARRDNYIRTHGLQTDQFPQATFVATKGITIAATAEKGQAVQVTCTGNLTIHGVTKLVSIPLSVQLSGSQIQVVGSLVFPFSEFGMTPPSIGGFVSVQPNATLEFSLLLTHG
jgi:polyisoprenoid-binding protein YceI